MRGDISLLNVYCGAAMVEVYLCSKKNLRFDGFSGCKLPSSRQGQTACCFSVLPVILRTMKRVTEMTEVKQQQPNNSTKSMNSHQKSQEYIKGKTSLFIL